MHNHYDSNFFIPLRQNSHSWKNPQRNWKYIMISVAMSVKFYLDTMAGWISGFDFPVAVTGKLSCNPSFSLRFLCHKASAVTTRRRHTNVDRFKYRGSYVAKGCKLREEITTRIQATSSAFGRLRHRVFDNHDLSINTKINK